ncbi:fibronectin type III domain-containing protein 10 [Xyrichtys novacula]|uniref:Fibronectin type III domain-containing protein 10 n=1 Tax=Xyrichtys novacula TaxID=13765 RepID=A0AAV1EQU4_XYRNO|nr:fibronectin type III domain-containing protein 10 [Xyrichtys novacula]
MRGGEMKSQQSLFALSALLLCTLQQTAGSSRSHRSSSSPASSASLSTSSPSEVRGRIHLGMPPTWLKQTGSNYGNLSHKSRPSPRLKEVTGQVNSFPFNTSTGNVTTVVSESSGRLPSWILEKGESPLCAYRVIEGGIGGQLCFRNTLFGYKCPKADCRTVVSLGNLVANILINGSVLLQWTLGAESTVTGQDEKTKGAATGQKSSGISGTDQTREGTVRSSSVFSGRRHRRGGYELSCWWNGSYTQFECAGVHLGSGCRDFLLTELHENIPYRICLRSLAHSDPVLRAPHQQDCVEFTLPPSGMQDIVIAMTTVGGAICVMLVIICLLVAYITENIMSPTTQHTYSYRTHSRR